MGLMFGKDVVLAPFATPAPELLALRADPVLSRAFSVEGMRVASEDLDAGAVTGGHIADGAVGTAKLPNGAVTNDKVAAGIAGSKIAGAVAVATNAGGATTAEYVLNTAGYHQSVTHQSVDVTFADGSTGTITFLV